MSGVYSDTLYEPGLWNHYSDRKEPRRESHLILYPNPGNGSTKLVRDDGPVTNFPLIHTISILEY